VVRNDERLLFLVSRVVVLRDVAFPRVAGELFDENDLVLYLVTAKNERKNAPKNHSKISLKKTNTNLSLE
tara:strand:- start:485 stop:694 length:210 start_codon:yes stop_codon:yes gene_type:complete